MEREVATTYREKFVTLPEALDFVLARQPIDERMSFTAHVSTETRMGRRADDPLLYRVTVTVTEGAL